MKWNDILLTGTQIRLSKYSKLSKPYLLKRQNQKKMEEIIKNLPYQISKNVQKKLYYQKKLDNLRYKYSQELEKKYRPQLEQEQKKVNELLMDMMKAQKGVRKGDVTQNELSEKRKKFETERDNYAKKEHEIFEKCNKEALEKAEKELKYLINIDIKKNSSSINQQRSEQRSEKFASLKHKKGRSKAELEQILRLNNFGPGSGVTKREYERALKRLQKSGTDPMKVVRELANERQKRRENEIQQKAKEERAKNGINERFFRLGEDIKNEVNKPVNNQIQSSNRYTSIAKEKRAKRVKQQPIEPSVRYTSIVNEPELNRVAHKIMPNNRYSSIAREPLTQKQAIELKTLLKRIPANDVEARKSLFEHQLKKYRLRAGDSMPTSLWWVLCPRYKMQLRRAK